MKIRNQIALLLCLALPVGAQSLKKDGTIGKVVDAQGMASVRPLLGQRWSPAEINLVVKPGDWIRTDTRGANAVKIRLQTGSTLTLGPGALVECIKADEIKLMRGDVEVAPAEGKTSAKGVGPFKCSGCHSLPLSKTIVRVLRLM